MMETESLKKIIEIGVNDTLAYLKATKVIPQNTSARMTRK